MKNDYITSRLSLSKLQLSDRAFIQQLVNTEGWIQFIGDRKIHTEEAAIAYIEKLLNSPHITYWVVRLLEDNTSIGVVTLIKREYLPHHDIGFAFLPEYGQKGYAFEAATAILDAVTQYPQHTTILATTLKDNVNSIHLLQKMGFVFEKEMELENEPLLVYAFLKQAAPL